MVTMNLEVLKKKLKNVKLLTGDARWMTMHDDAQRPIAIGHMGDLKIL